MPRVKQFNQEEILEKAKNLFWKQGYHATSIQNLVDHLGINRASLYDTFGGKNSLYEAAFQAYKKESQTFLRTHFEEADSIKDAIHILFKNSVAETVNDPDKKGCFVVNCTTEYLPKHNHILQDLIDNKKTFEDIISMALEKGKQNGEFNNQLNIKEIATYLFAFFSGLKVIAKVNQDCKELDKTIDLGLGILQ